MADNPRLLVIDDDPEVCEFIEVAARSLNFVVLSVSEPDQVDDAYRTFQPTVIFLDLIMPERDGIQILRFLADEKCEALILLMSAFDQPMVRRATSLGEALGLNLSEPLHKPVQLEDLRAVSKIIA